MIMFCVDCGEEKAIFRDGSCLECYLKGHQFTKGPAFIDISICAHCGSFKYKSLWSHDKFEEVVIRHVKQMFSIGNELKGVRIDVTCTKEQERFSCNVTIVGSVDEVPISESHHLYVRLKQQSCDVCSKQFGGYHEAILQIRPFKRKISAEELMKIRQYVETTIASMQEQGHRNLFIADVSEEHGGIDFYLSDKQVGATIIKKVQEKYGGVITTSSKNIGMKDSKQLYRVTFLIRLPPYQKGEFVEFNGEYFYIFLISQSSVHLINLATWEKRSVNPKDFENVKVLGGKQIVQDMLFISQNDSEVQVMEPKNYKVMILKKPQAHCFDTDVVKVVFIDENIFFLSPLEKQK